MYTPEITAALLSGRLEIDTSVLARGPMTTVVCDAGWHGLDGRLRYCHSRSSHTGLQRALREAQFHLNSNSILHVKIYPWNPDEADE